MQKKNKEKPLKTGEKQGLGRGGNPPPKEYQWKPGQSGNIKGRPLSITAEIRKDLKKGKLKEVKEKIWELVKKGNWKAIEKIWEYMDGKPTEHIKLGAEEETIAKMEDLMRALSQKKK